MTLMQKKEELLRLAKAGAPRPKSQLDPLGDALIRLARKEPSFVEELYRHAPDWRINRTPWTLDNVVAFYLDNKRLPSRTAACPVERHLAQGLDKRLAKGHRLYSPVVEAWAKDKLHARRAAGYARRADKRSMAVQCLNTLQIFPSQSEAARAYGLKPASVSQATQPGRSTRSGLRFIPVEAMV